MGDNVHWEVVVVGVGGFNETLQLLVPANGHLIGSGQAPVVLRESKKEEEGRGEERGEERGERGERRERERERGVDVLVHRVSSCRLRSQLLPNF